MKRGTTHLLLSALALALLPVGPAAAEATGATIDKTGWWNRVNATTSTPAGPVTVPPPPGIPDDRLVVGALPNEATAITGIGIQPDEGPGATVIDFTLRITEDPDAPSNQGTEGAVIIACPIVEFWAGGGNGPWDTRPEADCDAASVPGTRDDDGVWEFDLAPIAELWFDPFATIIADGVVLRPDLAETTPFQAVFRGGDEIDVVLEAEPGPEEEDPFASPGFDEPIATDSGTRGSFGQDIFSPPITSAPDSLDPSDAPETDETETGDEAAAPPLNTPVTVPAATRAGDLAGNFSPLVLVGLAGFAALFVAMSYWLGPAGQPVTAVRQRGVSRALDARARVTKGY